MSESFDAYYRWLGIPPHEQPPHHYRLLGLTIFEADPEVISDAADRQMAHVRTYQLGPQADRSQTMLNEIAAARVCLLNPQKKAAYDTTLRQQLAPPTAAGFPVAAPVSPPLPPAPARALAAAGLLRSDPAANAAFTSPAADAEPPVDAELAQWLDGVAHGARRAGPRAKTQTSTGSPTGNGQSPLNARRAGKGPRTRWPRAWLAVAGGAAGVVLLGLLFSMRTREGTLVVEISDPEATVQVINGEGKLLIEQRAGAEKVEISVVPGRGKLRVVKNGVELLAKEFTLVSGGRETINARLVAPVIAKAAIPNPEPAVVNPQPPAPPPAVAPAAHVDAPVAADQSPAPPPAVAPFDATQAKQHQEAWAKHLGIPAEMTNSIGMKFVLIPPGDFTMGSPPEERGTFRAGAQDQLSQHRVRISHAFYLGMHTVTQSQYEKVTDVNPSGFAKGGGDSAKVVDEDTSRYPVENVSWLESTAFCKRLSKAPGECDASHVYRLPTEAEWECACRAGTATRYYFGDSDEVSEEHVWLRPWANNTTHPVGQKKPNPWGLFDMYGNVWQWCADWCDADYYLRSPTADPHGPESGTIRVLRGGNRGDPARNVSSGARTGHPPTAHYSCDGFRAVCEINGQPVAESTAAQAAREPAATRPADRPVTPEQNSVPAASGSPPAVAPFDASQAKPSPAAAAPAATKQKLPVPGDAALAEARKGLDASFKTEIEKATTSAEKGALANRLLSQAIDKTDDPVGKYALMGMAEDLATSARDAYTMFQVIDRMAEAFDVDRFAMKTGILVDWAKNARTPEARTWLVEQAIGVGSEALDADNLEAAKELGKLATSKASFVRDKNLTQALKVYRQRLTEAGKDIDELQAAQAALAKDAQDPQANLAVGQHLCFTKGDWKKGLPLLAQGSDDSLKRLAHQELASPTQSDAQVALADAWWEIARTRRPSQMIAIKLHAGQWYRRADAGLAAGPVKNHVEKQLAEVEKLRSQLPSPPLAIAPFGEKQAKEHQQRWAEHLGVPVIETNSIGMKLVLIPPGEFDMGSTPEEIAAEVERAKGNNGAWLAREAPRHRVRISKPFYFGRYHVTQGEYEKVMGANPSSYTEKQMDVSAFKPPLDQDQKKRRDNDKQSVIGKDTTRYPVNSVSWDDAMEFCRRLSAIPAERAARRVYRLPSEAEWEHACRAGTTTRWYSGDDEASLREFANGMHSVGEKKPNAWDLCDMHGLVLQWCADWYSGDYYKHSPPFDPGGPPAGSSRVLRGGWWHYGEFFARSACRFLAWTPATHDGHGGFRVVVGR